MQRLLALGALIVALTSVSTAAMSAVSPESPSGHPTSSSAARPAATRQPPRRARNARKRRATSSRPRPPQGRAGRRRQARGPATIALAGDVHAEAPIRGLLDRGANPLARIADHLRRADLAMVNVETAVSRRGTPAAKSFVFRAPDSLWRALAAAGVDVVTLANNHSLDYGPLALADTIRGARRAGLAVVGAGRDPSEAYAPAVVEHDGRTVAFVGLSRVLPSPAWEAGGGRPGVASAFNERLALASVRAAARSSDRVVVSIHWGEELHRCPSGVQQALAARLVAAGADVVAGHHPHVLQGISRRANALIGYSLGNFAFYARDEVTRSTGVLTAAIPARGRVGYEFEPARIGAEGGPGPLRPRERQRRLEQLAAQAPGAGRCARARSSDDGGR